MNLHDDFNPRRRYLLGAALAGALAPMSTLSFAASSAAPGGPRFVFVILRGGLDGLSAVPAIGDPAFASARGPLGQFAQPPRALDATFALHPSLEQLHAMYGRGELAVLHAVGLPYRDRSHFDAQQVLESGGVRPYELSTGWLARALAPARSRSVALATAVPLVLRGPDVVVDTWAPSALPDPGADLVHRLGRMYADDPALAGALDRASTLHFGAAMGAESGMSMAGAGRGNGTLPVLAQRAAEFLADPQGPQAAVLEMSGWDTHANQANPNGPLANNLRQLDAGLAALRDGLLPSATWNRTVVVVATEFGREVAVNGTLGTDHGTGAAAFVLGGAVRGGRVLADWPGLAKAQRNEGRDLKITMDMRGVLRGLLADHMRVANATLDGSVFPGSTGSAGATRRDLLRA